MSNPTNPLLVDIRAIPAFVVPCFRVYTTRYKGGGFRVKFFNHAPNENMFHLLRHSLIRKGWSNVKIEVSDNHRHHSLGPICSTTVTAI